MSCRWGFPLGDSCPSKLVEFQNNTTALVFHVYIYIYTHTIYTFFLKTIYTLQYNNVHTLSLSIYIYISILVLWSVSEMLELLLAPPLFSYVVRKYDRVLRLKDIPEVVGFEVSPITPYLWTQKNITKNMKGFKVPPQKIVGEWWLITHKHATIYPSTFSKVPWTPWSLPQVVCTPYELSRDHQDLADTVGGTKRLGDFFFASFGKWGFRGFRLFPVMEGLILLEGSHP